jgi:lipopolysaccharide transport system ATP-binding protein
MYGEVFDVTREYLAYHEEKRAVEQPAGRAAPGSAVPRTEQVTVSPAQGETFETGGAMVMSVIMTAPDGRAPVALIGIVRADGTPVFGTHSDENGYVPRRLPDGRFEFGLHIGPLPLLPGRYKVRVHALEAQGLLLTDTYETHITVSGRSRDYGVVRLEHRWLDGGGDGRGG